MLCKTGIECCVNLYRVLQLNVIDRVVRSMTVVVSVRGILVPAVHGERQRHTSCRKSPSLQEPVFRLCQWSYSSKWVKRTRSFLAPRTFRPFFSNSCLCTRSSRNHWRAIAYSCVLELDAVISAEGHGVGKVTKEPSRIWAMCVGNSFRPSKMCVASVEVGS